MSMLKTMLMKKKGGGTLNATIVGTPTISSDFIVSNIDGNNYLKIKLQNPDNSANWEIGGKFKITDISNESKVVSSNPDQTGLRFAYKGDGASIYCFSFLISTDYGHYWITVPSYRTTILYSTENKWNYFKIGYNNNERYYAKLSDDGVIYDKTWFNVNTSQKANFSTAEYTMLGGNNTVIDMKEFYYKINNEIVWKGVI